MEHYEPLAFIALILGCLLYNFVVSPVQRGFFCDDESIRYPYIQTPTVNIAVLMIISILVPLASFLLLVVVVDRPRDWKKCFIRWLMQTIPFLYGELLTLFITLFTKCHTGRLRPYYLNYCQPDLDALCESKQLNLTSSSTGIKINHLYVTLDLVKCNRSSVENYYADRESRLSFFSGHSSLAAYAMFYMALAVIDQLPKIPIIVRFWVALMLSNVAFYVGYSRISDYHHHWSDVLVGLIVGIMFAQFTYYLITPKFLKTSDLQIINQTLRILGCGDALSSSQLVHDSSTSMVDFSASRSSLLASQNSINQPQQQYLSCGQLVKRNNNFEGVVASSAEIASYSTNIVSISNFSNV